jgi:hypothetical protein
MVSPSVMLSTERKIDMQNVVSSYVSFFFRKIRRSRYGVLYRSNEYGVRSAVTFVIQLESFLSFSWNLFVIQLESFFAIQLESFGHFVR